MSGKGGTGRKRLPKELKKLRAEARLCWGRGRYEEAHNHAALVYAYRLLDRADERRQRKERGA